MKGTPGDFVAIFSQGKQLLRVSVCFSAHQSSSETGSAIKGKNPLRRISEK